MHAAACEHTATSAEPGTWPCSEHRALRRAHLNDLFAGPARLPGAAQREVGDVGAGAARPICKELQQQVRCSGRLDGNFLPRYIFALKILIFSL